MRCAVGRYYCVPDTRYSPRALAFTYISTFYPSVAAVLPPLYAGFPVQVTSFCPRYCRFCSKEFQRLGRHVLGGVQQQYNTWDRQPLPPMYMGFLVKVAFIYPRNCLMIGFGSIILSVANMRGFWPALPTRSRSGHVNRRKKTI